MGMVNNGKLLHGKVIEMLCPQRVVFHHVPKCGGTSVGRSLRTKYLLSQATVTPESSYRAFEAFTGRNDREQMLVDVLDLREQMMLYLMFEDVRCVSLHVRFSQTAHRFFSDRYKFVTILREPVERFLSHYYWSHGKSGAHGRIEEGFEAFLKTPRAQRLGATYAEYYSGLGKDTDFRSRFAVEHAIDNLKKFDVVGRLDQLDDFQQGLHSHLGLKIKVGHENKGIVKNSRYELSDELMRKVTLLCQPDIDIWEAVFDER